MCNKKFYKKDSFLVVGETWMKHGVIFLGERIEKTKIALYAIMRLEINFVLNF